MSRKTLNKNNLIALGAETLAELLLDITQGNATQQRRLRMELSAHVGASDVARDIRKRFSSLRRSTSYIEWRQQNAFARELSDLVDLIRARVAPDEPDEAFDLLWAFLSLAPSIYERVDDSHGTIGMVMSDAMEAISEAAPRLSIDGHTVAERVFEGLQDNGYGQFDGAIPALADALGTEGAERLKQLAWAVQDAPLSAGDAARYDFIDDPDRQHEMAREDRDRTAGMVLQDVADLQGDVDAYMARYSAEQLTFHTIAPDVARRLLDAGRAEEALSIVEGARTRDRNLIIGDGKLDEVQVACLDTLDRGEEAKTFLWDLFCQTLNPESLRQHIRRLPDFEDIEAADRARDHAMAHQNMMTALSFFHNWQDPGSAAQLIETRFAELDGNAYYILTPVADALEGDHPLAATLARRAMILDTLENKRSKRYRYAAKHLAECSSSDRQISEYGSHPTHAGFTASLRKTHPRKTAFWDRVPEGI
ncbi:DUF6880 family protein [Ruegeria sp. EL01]|jgi:hypothetical protein|uniref:DUF6880 family protein n=1 Tax=Ruegeria sp. EL01 TaxID=2107578 RepID=UPI000EA81DE4|nr:DUF6880 family protein [Ruegeria sp. EL01]